MVVDSGSVTKTDGVVAREGATTCSSSSDASRTGESERGCKRFNLLLCLFTDEEGLGEYVGAGELL